MHWINLLAAIILEVLGTISMKLSKGFTNFWPSVMLFVFHFFSFTSLTFALKKINISVAYTIWAGLGMVLITIIGVRYFNEKLNPLKLVSIGLILIGVVGLNLADLIGSLK